MKNEIVLKANCEFKDKELREIVNKLISKIESMNNKWKILSMRISNIEKYVTKN